MIMAHLWQAARRLWRSKVFAVTALLTLGIGVGVSASMIHLLDALLLRPPPHVAQPDHVRRLIFVSGNPITGFNDHAQSSYPVFDVLRRSKVFSSIAAYAGGAVSVGVGPTAVEARALFVTTDFFGLLGVPPALGTFPAPQGHDAEDAAGVVVSYGFWRQRFGGRSDVVGSTVLLDSRAYQVVAVAPENFNALWQSSTDIWLPLAHVRSTPGMPDKWRSDAHSYWLEVLARMKSGQSEQEAQQHILAVLSATSESYGDDLPGSVKLASLVQARSPDRPPEVKVSLWLAGLSTLVLLAACANITNLALARDFARSNDFSVRLALGATKGDLARTLLVELAVLGVPAVLLSAFLVTLASALLSRFLALDIVIGTTAWDGRVLLITGGMMCVALTVVGAASIAMLATTSSRSIALRTSNAESPRGRSVRHVLLAVQAGLCLFLVFSAGLFAKSLQRVEGLDLGAAVDETVQITINLPRDTPLRSDVPALYAEAEQHLMRHPAVLSVAVAERSPYMMGRAVSPWTAERSSDDLWREGGVPFITAVGTRYFTTVGAASLRGRDFTSSDRRGSELVAIVNEPLARRIWPDGRALGKCVWYDDSSGCARVVGILGGVWKFSALRRDRMVLYVPLAQLPDVPPGALLVRLRDGSEGVIGELRSLVQGIHPSLPAVTVTPLSALVAKDYRRWRQGASLFSLFGVVASLIAAVGLYGVVSFTTSLRNREIGVRLSLGAHPIHIIRLIGGQGIVAVALGMFGGFIGSLALSRWFGDMLFQTSPHDLGVLTWTAAALVALSGLAILHPVVRALRTNPATVLRGTE